MRFLIDESTGQSVAEFLRGLGHDVLVVSEVMPQATDTDILARAVAESRIVLTNDKDFGELVFRSEQPHAGVLLLRLQDESPGSRVRLVQTVLERCGTALPDRFVVATEKHIRIRP
jgi:predicted nuclease of predicted toxin-antitoxin system